MGGALRRWIQVGAAVPGRAHLSASVPCQDSVQHLQDQGVSAIALGDGAGSRPLSHHGSSALTRATCEYLCANFETVSRRPLEDTRAALCAYLFDELARTAGDLQKAPGDLASTLLFVATSGPFTIIGHIGDGVIAGLSDDGMEPVSLPERGEFANQTLFFGGPETWSHLRLQGLSPGAFSAYALMSDGAADSLYQRRSQTFAPAVRHMADWLLEYPRSVVEAALHQNLADLIRNKTSDDCSCGITHRVNIDINGLWEKSWAFRRELLGATNGVDAKNRLRVLSLLARKGSEFSARDVGLSRATIRRHLGIIGSLGIEATPPPGAELGARG